MLNSSRLGPGTVAVVAVVALIFGGVAGAIAGSRFSTSSTKTVQVVEPTGGQSPAQDVSTANSPPLSWVQVARLAEPAVVTIINQQLPQQDIFGNSVPGGTAEGSGFIIDRKGDIVTNNHVVLNAQSLTIVFSDGHKASAQVVRADPTRDLAVVRVGVPVPAVLHFGNSNALQPGEPVLAIGSALGDYRNTVTAGVVSALGRTITEPNAVQLHDMVQTDAAINQGNSGGPLINSHDQVIGVNTVVERGTQSTNIFGGGTSVVAEGLGFAIASSTVQPVVARLVQNKPPAFLGVQYHVVSQQEATYYSLPVGAYVNNVATGSPAERAGLRPRDVITRINGQKLTGSVTLEQIIGNASPGQTVTLTVWRTGQTLTIKVKLGSKPGSS
jgi:2-alkenal reductase